MIKKELYRTREDGVQLYRTFSDTDHVIKKVVNDVVYNDAIDVDENAEYVELDEYIELDGPESYEEALSAIDDLDVVSRKINRIGLTDEEALSVKELYPRWESKINSTIEMGYITLHNDNLWKARITHTALEHYPPSLDTASLYEVVEKEHSGTIDDPIPYVTPMEIFEGKYYVENEILYLCIRDSEIALTHNLSDLVDIYVESV